MKFLLGLCFSFFSIALFSQPSQGIEYSPDGKFHWGLFRGKVNQKHIAEMGENTGAVTVSSLSYKTLEIKGGTAVLKITAQFHPNESWTRYPELYHPDEALLHEKKHFEICEIYARKIRRAVSETRFTKRNFNNELTSLFKRLAREHRSHQTQYDHETAHSIDREEQRRWNEMIDRELASLEDYAGSVVKVTLN